MSARVAWSLVFIGMLYVSAPALAVLVKYEVMAHLVGQPFDSLPAWMAQWSHDPALLSFSDVNGDGILQFAELKIGIEAKAVTTASWFTRLLILFGTAFALAMLALGAKAFASRQPDRI